MKLFIADSLISLMLRDREEEVDINYIKLSWENIVYFVPKVPLSHIRSNENVNTQRIYVKIANDDLFVLLRWEYIFMFRTKDIEKNVETCT